MALIDLSNYSTSLYQASDNTGTDGNVYFDREAGTIQFFTATTNPTLNLTTHGGDSSAPNPLLLVDGLKFEALYAFENQERRVDTTLRQYDRWTSGTFKFGGAYNLINNRTFLTSADRALVRGSGWNEYNTAGISQRTRFGIKGLSNIYTGSQPYYQLNTFTTAIDFAKPGQIDEAVDVGGALFTDNTLNPLVVSVRTYGNTYDRKSSTTDLGIAELGGYSSGFAVNERPHLTTNVGGAHPFDDVWTTPTGPWASMTLTKLDTPVTISGFAEGSGTFTWTLNNPDGSTLDECVAYLDAIATVTTDIDAGSQTVTIGKDVDVWYSYNAAGQVVTKSGADNLGLYIYNIPIADQQRVLFTNDTDTTNSYLFTVGIQADIGATAKADTNAWYHSYFAGNYNTAGAVTILDKSGAAVTGNASTADASNLISFGFDYDGDTLGGASGTNKNAVFLCEGDGGATQAKTLYTITRTTNISFSCIPGVENNA